MKTKFFCFVSLAIVLVFSSGDILSRASNETYFSYIYTQEDYYLLSPPNTTPGRPDSNRNFFNSFVLWRMLGIDISSDSATQAYTSLSLNVCYLTFLNNQTSSDGSTWSSSGFSIFPIGTEMNFNLSTLFGKYTLVLPYRSTTYDFVSYVDPFQFLNETYYFGLDITDTRFNNSLYYRIQARLSLSFTVCFPLNLQESSFESGVTVSLQGISQSLSELQSILQNGFTSTNAAIESLKQYLQNIVNAINNQTGGSGGFTAIKDAIDSMSSSLGTILQDINGGVAQTNQQLVKNLQDTLESLAQIDSSVADVLQEIKDIQQRNMQAAQEQGNQITGMVTKLSSDFESRLGILKVPIDFTAQVFSVFSNGTQSTAYVDAYRGVIGYRYDEETGALVPVRRSISTLDLLPVPTGTILTFPSFTLPIPNYGDIQIWDSFDFDISQIKSSFPILFDAIYLISGVVIIYHFIAYIIDWTDDILD